MVHSCDTESPDALTLLPGQAVHLGHSCVLLDVAGLRLLHDPATLTGYATGPFANLTTSDCRLKTYRPLTNVPALIGSPRRLAQAADVVLYSHMHADHFNAGVLLELLAHRPDLKVILPRGGSRLLRSPRLELPGIMESARRVLARLEWLDTSPAGLEAFLRSTPIDLRGAFLSEVDDGSVVVLRESPRVELRAFAVTHPRPLMWVPTPFEAAFPPVLGYEIGYDDEGVWRHVLLVGETALDAGVLQRIADRSASVTSVFLPVDLPLGGRWLAPWYEHVCHASPRFLAMAARLAGPHATIIPIHQGLWCYDFDPGDVPELQRGATGRALSVADALAGARAQRRFGPARLRAWQTLTDTLAAFQPTARIADPEPGAPFALDSGPATAQATPIGGLLSVEWSPLGLMPAPV